MKKLLLSLLLFAAPVFAQTTTTTVRISWAEATPGATFNVYRWYKALPPALAGANGFQKMNAAPITAMTYDDTTAVLGTSYSYKITAVNSAGESAPTPEADITVSAPVIVPAVPTNLKVSIVITN
jgi:fibronectin type 3 domain-containing protein